MALRRVVVAAPALLAALALRAAAFGLLWWILAEGNLRYPLIIAGGVAAAVATSLVLLPPGGRRWRILGFLRFVPFFLRESLLGGVDVARRALQPGLTIQPAFIEFRLGLPEGAPRMLFVAVVSLLPGTLSTELEGDSLLVHALDERLPVHRTLARLQARVADLYGVEQAARPDAG